MTKLTSLAEAVSQTVKPGATLLFGFTHNRSHASVYEVARQFKDQQALVIVATGLLEYASILCAAGAVKGLESAFAGNTYPSPGPSRVLIGQMKEIERFDPDWTNLTMTLRLQAGAMGWPFIPTASFTPEADISNGPGRKRIQNPFGDGKFTVIAALNPDVAFLHAPVADTNGNTIIEGPDAEGLWGAWAAKKVVVTADRVISPQEFRNLAPVPGLPGNRVDYVVEAPFGAHPQGQFVWREDLDVRSYAEDYSFRRDIRKLTRDPEALRDWVEEWVFGHTHQSYLAKLGDARLQNLKDESENPTIVQPDGAETETSSEETAAIIAKRLAVDAATHDGLNTFFAGIGLSHLAAWSAEEECRLAGVNVDLVAETGMYGFRPLKGDPYLFNKPNAANSLFHSGFVPMLGSLAGPGAQNILAFLAAGQIDVYGNINSSRNANGGLIVGSGGANDLVSGNAEYIVVMPASQGRFVSKLPFVTSPAGNLRAVATDLGVLCPSAGDGQLVITGVVAQIGRETEVIAQIREICGTQLDVAEQLECIEPPSEGEVTALRAFDPERIILS